VLAKSHLATTVEPALMPVTTTASARVPAACSDEKVANREIRVWHFVIENGY
jgi:hypothetical protein